MNLLAINKQDEQKECLSYDFYVDIIRSINKDYN